jgi:hypothetical protein
MSQPVAKVCIALTLVACLIGMTSLGWAEETSYETEEMAADVSAEDILVDTLLLRPIGIVATLVGVAAFIVALPFSLPTRSTDKVAQKLVVAPAQYTFVRPLGQT